MNDKAREPIWTLPFILAFAGHFVFALGFWTFVHLPGFLEELGGKEAEIGTIMGTIAISAILIRPWIGKAMDSRGRRPVVIFGAIIYFIATSAYLSVDSLGPWVYVIRIIHGLGEAALFSVMFTIAADAVPASRRTEGIAIFGVSGLLPLSMGGLLGDWILSNWDYHMLFTVSAVISLVAMFVCLGIPETRPDVTNRETANSGILSVFLNRSLRPLWVLTLGFTFGITSYFTFLKTYIADGEIGSVGSFFLAYSIASVGLRVFFSWIPERLGLKRTLIPSLLCLVAGILVLGNATSGTQIAIAGALCGLGHGYIFPILSALVVTRTEVAFRGVAMTLFTALFDVGALIGAPLLGWVIESNGYSTMFSLAAVMVLSLSGLYFVLDRND
ncbi:MAG: MFS transporter [Kofleriaceae bacterium]|nr:MFS transporter [Kofleriaceae bacterium]